MPRSRTAGALFIALALLASRRRRPAPGPARTGATARPRLAVRADRLPTLPTGDGPTPRCDPATRTLYVTNDTSNDVSVIDVEADGPRVPVGAVPAGLAVNDRTLYVANIEDGPSP